MPPPSLSAAPLPGPRPTPPALTWVWNGAWEGAWPQVISARPPKICPDCQPHTDLTPRDRVLPPSPDCALTSSSLVSPAPAWGFGTSCQMDKRKEAPDGLVEEGVRLEMGLNPQSGSTRLAEVSFWGQRGTLAGFQDTHLQA